MACGKGIGCGTVIILVFLLIVFFASSDKKPPSKISTPASTAPQAYGTYTKDSIRAMLGEPSQIKRAANGKETWIYTIRPGEEDFPIYRLLSGYRNVKGFIFTFEKDGTLK